MTTRLNKFLSECGIASRRKAEEFIKEGRVAINGKTVVELFHTIEDDDVVELDGEKIKREKKVYFLLNKPRSVITSTNDEKNRKTVVDLIKTDKKIFPVGRLDYDTTGVLILTNDGEFANFLMHPKNNIPREYLAVLDKPINQEDKERLLKGITLDGKKSKFLKIFFPSKKSFAKLIVTTNEGRNHFVKNMFSALGYKVKALERLTYAGLQVDDLPAGTYRKLNNDEVRYIFEKYKR